MFSTVGLFKAIQCPRESECSLPNCFFGHDAQKKPLQNVQSSLANEYNAWSAGDVEQPLPKRRRLNTEAFSTNEELHKVPIAHGVVSSTSDIPTARSTAKPPSSQISAQANNSTTTPIRNHRSSANTTLPPKPVSTTPQTRNHNPVLNTTLPLKPVSITRPVSPPGRNSSKTLPPLPSEKLAPRTVSKAPVPFKSRLSYIELLHKLAKTHNLEVQNGPASDQHLALKDFELIKLVLDDEEQAASASSIDVYKNTMSQRYLRYKNISITDWKALVTEKFRANEKSDAPRAGTLLTSGLTAPEEIELLRGLKTAVSGLEAYGYVTAPPSASLIDKSAEAVSSSRGFETCDRCGTRFQVYPGRNHEGRLTTQGECFYHWARIPKTQTAKNARMFGHADSLYPCCNQAPGSEGCTKAGSHVFKVSDPKRLASLWQFERTPDNPQRPRTPVAFDCEMAYTTYGMELVRVTAISWPEKEELLDILVRPYGEILDLNTRFSGVSQEQFANATPYENTLAFLDSNKESDPKKALRKVETPALARKLLFQLLAPDTPLIGHAIENDLNACRIVHPFIVDTVLLYPHPAGLPIRYGLKVLASKYLQRGIQMAGAEGHDSKEDSVATGDLVRLKVAEKWRTMKAQGWRFQSARLVAPTNS